MSKIDAFEAGTDRWLISINMISEGVDIPRLRVISYLTNITSEVYFHQVVGRALRGEGDAHVYILDDPILRKYAQVFSESREIALDELEKLPPTGGDEGGDRSSSGLKSLGGETEEAGVIFGSHRIDREEYVASQDELEQGGWPPPVPHEIVGKFIIAKGRQRDASHDQPGGMKSERKESLRQRQNRLVRAYCYRTPDREYSRVNYELNERVGIRKIRHATEEQLIERLKLAQELYDSVKESADAA